MERDKGRDRKRERWGEIETGLQTKRGSRDSEAEGEGGRNKDKRVSILTFCAKTLYVGETEADPE